MPARPRIHFKYRIEVSPRKDHWAAKVANLGITVYAQRPEEAEARATEAVLGLGDHLQSKFGFEGALTFLRERGVNHVLTTAALRAYSVEREAELVRQ